MRTKFQLYTVPGQVYYDATRKLVLQGCDGIVFVADSNPDLMAENIESLDNLGKNLKENGLDLMDVPLVLQFNKRDLPNAMPVAEMNAKLNRNNWPAIEAVAVNGDGVFQTLKAISQGVIKRLNREQGYQDDGQKRGRASALGGAARPPAQGEASNRGLTASPSLAPGAKAPTPGPKPLTMAPKVAPPPPKTSVPAQAPLRAPVPAAVTPVVTPRPASKPASTPVPSAAVTAPQPPRTNANPFRERLNQIRKQSGSELGPAAPSAAATAPQQDDDETPMRKGCSARAAKGGAAIALAVVAIGYCVLKFTAFGASVAAYFHMTL
jgi:hypothetical protein